MPTYGFRTATSTEEIRVNLDALVWRFVEGYVAEHELWREVLAAQHFDGVKDAIHQASERPEGFVLGVELWARICYDYLLAYNAQVIDHDRLVSSMIRCTSRARRPSSARSPTTPPSRPKSGSRPSPRCSWPPSPT